MPFEPVRTMRLPRSIARLKGDEDESVLILLQVSLEPRDVLLVEIVGRLIEKEDLRLFEEELAQEHFGALTAGELCDIPVQSEVGEAERAGYFRDLRVDGVKVVRGQKLLEGAGLLHVHHHFFFRAVRHEAVQLVTALLHLIEVVKGARQDILNGHACSEVGVLVEVSGRDMSGPLHGAFIRLQFSCDDTHEGGFSLAVCADKADMFPFEKTERNVFKDRPVAKSMCQVLYV